MGFDMRNSKAASEISAEGFGLRRASPLSPHPASARNASSPRLSASDGNAGEFFQRSRAFGFNPAAWNSPDAWSLEFGVSPRGAALAAARCAVYLRGVELQFRKHFQIEEARGLLSTLRDAFGNIHASRDRLVECESRLSRRLAKTGGDLGGPAVRTLLEAMVEIHEGITAITSRGIQIKDLDRGLVDFPHLRNGREVFLCWELEDDDIEFWHDLESGYAGRERL